MTLKRQTSSVRNSNLEFGYEGMRRVDAFLNSRAEFDGEREIIVVSRHHPLHTSHDLYMNINHHDHDREKILIGLKCTPTHNT